MDPYKLPPHVLVLVELIENGYQLFDIIDSGVARELYSKELADAAKKHLEGLAALLAVNLEA